uniref:RNB domain-containing protein n=1 Tax=Triticum urartu TaxID=4572 RepID=A0A8R7UHQ3_TRIUA
MASQSVCRVQSTHGVQAFAYPPKGYAGALPTPINVLCAAEMDFQKPLAHGVLGIPGYVQFTSHTRRYVDLLAHYQERQARG